jgi:hypothetical protein
MNADRQMMHGHVSSDRIATAWLPDPQQPASRWPLTPRMRKETTTMALVTQQRRGNGSCCRPCSRGTPHTRRQWIMEVVRRACAGLGFERTFRQRSRVIIANRTYAYACWDGYGDSSEITYPSTQVRSGVYTPAGWQCSRAHIQQVRVRTRANKSPTTSTIKFRCQYAVWIIPHPARVVLPSRWR